MKALILAACLALLPTVVFAESDCVKLASFKMVQAKKLQTAQLRTVPYKQWSAFLQRSNAEIDAKYAADSAACEASK